jgi:hypothetical protein
MGKRQVAPDGAETSGECLVYEVPVAGAMIGLNRNSSYRAAANGDLPTIRIGRLLKVPKAAFHRMLEQPAKAS